MNIRKIDFKQSDSVGRYPSFHQRTIKIEPADIGKIATGASTAVLVTGGANISEGQPFLPMSAESNFADFAKDMDSLDTFGTTVLGLAGSMVFGTIFGNNAYDKNNGNNDDNKNNEMDIPS